jgi:hypothetical protein
MSYRSVQRGAFLGKVRDGTLNREDVATIARSQFPSIVLPNGRVHDPLANHFLWTLSHIADDYFARQGMQYSEESFVRASYGTIDLAIAAMTGGVSRTVVTYRGIDSVRSRVLGDAAYIDCLMQQAGLSEQGFGQAITEDTDHDPAGAISWLAASKLLPVCSSEKASKEKRPTLLLGDERSLEKSDQVLSDLASRVYAGVVGIVAASENKQ